MKRKHILTTLLSVALSITMSITSLAAGSWQFDSTGWWWQRTDGTYPANTWVWIDGNGDGTAECYHFNSSGYLDISTNIDGSDVNSDGAWTVNGVVQTKPLNLNTNSAGYVSQSGSSGSSAANSSNQASTAQSASSSSSTQSDPIGATVYVSRTGSKYHSNPSCSNMKSPIKMTVDEAIATGRTPCSKCY